MIKESEAGMKVKIGIEMKMTIQIEDGDSEIRTIADDATFMLPNGNIMAPSEYMESIDTFEQANVALCNRMGAEMLERSLDVAVCERALASYKGRVQGCMLDSEFGQIPTFVTGGMAECMGSAKRLHSPWVAETQAMMAKDMSYRRAAALYNRVLHLKGEEMLDHRTLAHYVEQDGVQMREQIEDVRDIALRRIGLDPDTFEIISPDILDSYVQELTAPTAKLAAAELKQIQEKVDEYNGSHEDNQITTPVSEMNIEKFTKTCVYAGLDGVLVKQQKAERGEDKERDSRHLENVCGHLSWDGKTIEFTGPNVEDVAKTMLACLPGRKRSDDSGACVHDRWCTGTVEGGR